MPQPETLSPEVLNSPAPKMQAWLQALAPCLIRCKPDQVFLSYWTDLVQQAGVDLFEKACIQPDERPERDAIQRTNAAQDLTIEECLQVGLYLETILGKILEKWGKTLDHS